MTCLSQVDHETWPLRQRSATKLLELKKSFFARTSLNGGQNHDSSLESALHHFPRLALWNLAQHHDVGILAKERAQGIGEIEPKLRPHGHLAHVWQEMLDWILDARKRHGWRGKEIKESVEERRFPRTLGPRDY